MKTLHHRTLLQKSHTAKKKLGKDVYFKMEAFQPSGSFKIRGVGLLCSEAVAQGSTTLVCASGGNAGAAVAYAARVLGVEAHIVLPLTTSDAVCERIEAMGAKVQKKGKVWNESHLYAMDLSTRMGGTYIHPFDHPKLWEGHASIIDECAEEMAEPDAVVLAVGGGGLFTGIMQGLERNAWNRTKVLTAETIGAASFAGANAEKAHITLSKIDSIAGSLGAKQIARGAYAWIGKRAIESYTVSDKQAASACQHFLEEQGVLVEPACGAALAAVYENQELLKDYQSILVIVCGGRTYSYQQLQEYLKE